MNSMRFEKLSKKNMKEMVKIARLCFGKLYVDKEVVVWFHKKLDRDYQSVNDLLEYYLVFNGKKPVGITGFYKIKGENIFWLGYFAVLKAERRKGLGSQMLKKTISEAKSLGCRKFGAWTNSKKACRFYQKNGFRKGEKQIMIVVDGKIIYKYPRGSVFYYKNLY